MLQSYGYNVSIVPRDHPELGPGVVLPDPNVHSPSTSYHCLTRLQKITRERLVWRTRELLDYIMLLERIYNSTTAPYILMIQDDAYAADRFDQRLLRAVNNSTTWSHVILYCLKTWDKEEEYSIETIRKRDTTFLYGGSVAIVYRYACMYARVIILSSHAPLPYSREHIPDFIAYVRQDVFEEAIDQFMTRFYANMTLSDDLFPHEFVPNLFQHVGETSTLRV